MYFITGNAAKFREAHIMLPELEQLVLDLDEIQSLDPHIVIEHKLEQAAKHHGGEFIVDDTSMGLACLGGEFPGPLVKWLIKSIGLAGIADLASRYPDQSATVRAVIGYRNTAGESHYFTGELSGRLVAPRGEGMGWDPIFQPDGYDQTFAELGMEVKSTFSHRHQAIAQLKTYLEERA